MVRQLCLLLLVAGNQLRRALCEIRHIRPVPLAIAVTLLSMLAIVILLEVDYRRKKEVLREHIEDREIAVAFALIGPKRAGWTPLAAAHPASLLRS
jgi:hypothetical protein